MALVQSTSLKSLTVGQNNNVQEDTDGIRQDTGKTQPKETLQDIGKPRINISSEHITQTQSNTSSQDSGQIVSCIPTQQLRGNLQAQTSAEASPSIEESILYDDPNLPSGWRRLIKKRQGGNSAGRYDVLITSPEGKKFRSASKIKEYLERNPQLPFKSEDFNFSLTQDRNGYKTRLGSQSCQTTTCIRRKVKKVISKNIPEDKFPKGQVLSKPPIPSVEVTPSCHIIVNPCYTQIQQVILPPIPENSPEAQLILQNYKQSLANIAVTPVILHTPNMNQDMLPKFVLKSSTNQPKYPQESHKEVPMQPKYPNESDGYLIRNGNKLVRIKPKVPESALHLGGVRNNYQGSNKRPPKITVHRQNGANENNDDSIDYDVPELRICENEDLEAHTNNSEIISPPLQKRRKTMANTVLTSSTPRPRIMSNLRSTNNDLDYHTIFKIPLPLPHKNVESKQIPGLTQLSSRAPTTLISTMTPSRMSPSVQMPLNVIKMTNQNDGIQMHQTNDVIVIRPGDSTLSHEDIIEEDTSNEDSTLATPKHAENVEDCNVKNRGDTKIIRRITKSFDIRAFARSKGRQVIFGTSDPSKLPFLDNSPRRKWKTSISKPSSLINDSQNEVKNIKSGKNMNSNRDEFDIQSEKLEIKCEHVDTNSESLDSNIEHLNLNDMHLDNKPETILNGNPSSNVQSQVGQSNEIEDDSQDKKTYKRKTDNNENINNNNNNEHFDNKKEHLDTNKKDLDNKQEMVSNNNTSQEIQNQEMELDEIKDNSSCDPAFTSQQLRDMLFSDSDSDCDSD